MYGKHITIDAFCKSRLANSPRFIFNLLKEMPERIGMKAITAPMVIPYVDPNPDWDGVTGIVVISTSHIAIHTYPAVNYIFIDVFSCKDFSTEETVGLLKKKLKLEKVLINEVKRGVHFPLNLGKR